MRIFPVLAFLFLCSIVSRADEGMWMINAISEALEKKMQERGLRLSSGEIYNADSEGATLADAVVSLDFACTGSIISHQGLLITNHHCAYSDIHAMSTPDRNFLEEGFWAMKSSEECHVPGKKAWFLKKVLDVTEEVSAMLSDARAAGRQPGFRKLSWEIERRYREATGLEASLSSMWGGSKYYLALYKVYSDVRLVAAPPVSIAAFGGDTDNWEWPQHKCDFAMYRVYTAPDGSPAGYSEDNVPMVPDAVLDISLDGYRPGDFTMVIGYPGSTDRYSSSYKVQHAIDVTLPVTNEIRGRQMDIIRAHMESSPDVRLGYSDYYFSLSNVQELNEGEWQCYRRFHVPARKAAIEHDMQSWLDSSALRSSEWGGLLETLEHKYAVTAGIERNIAVYRETIVRGTRLARTCYRLNMLKNEVLKSRGIVPHRAIDSLPPSDAETECCMTYLFAGKDFPSVAGLLERDYEGLDMHLERALFRYAMEKYYTDVDSSLWGAYQRSLFSRHIRSGQGFDALCSEVWDCSFLTDTSRLNAFMSERHTVDEYLADPFYRFMQDVRIADLNRISADIEGKPTIASLDGEYERALYGMRLDRRIAQYPDANSTMRITYGTVGPLEPYDGIVCSWRSTTDGILEKYNPDIYEYRLDARQKFLLEEAGWGKWFSREDFSGTGAALPAGHDPGSLPMYVDFLTDNDITGGNSGSPVLDADGRLIGLAFDGNKESLASDSWYSSGYNKCVCVDIRYVLWVLDRYAGMDRILEELGL